MKMKKIELDIIPLFLSAVLIITSFIIVYSTNYAFTLKHYLGFAGFILSFYSYFRNRVLYFIVFTITLLAGLFGFIDFYYRSFMIGFGNFGVNPIFLILLIFLFVFIFYVAKKIDSQWISLISILYRRSML